VGGRACVERGSGPGLLSAQATELHAADTTLTLERRDQFLVIHGPHLPGGAIRIHYLEAY
jgi:hypothetical protein